MYTSDRLITLDAPSLIFNEGRRPGPLKILHEGKQIVSPKLSVNKRRMKEKRPRRRAAKGMAREAPGPEKKGITRVRQNE